MKLLSNKNFLMGVGAGLALVYLAKTQPSFSFIKSPLASIGVI